MYDRIQSLITTQQEYQKSCSKSGVTPRFNSQKLAKPNASHPQFLVLAAGSNPVMAEVKAEVKARSLSNQLSS